MRTLEKQYAALFWYYLKKTLDNPAPPCYYNIADGKTEAQISYRGVEQFGSSSGS